MSIVKKTFANFLIKVYNISDDFFTFQRFFGLWRSFMDFRPCIDIHNGRVKQIVGGSLADKNNAAKENFVSEYGAEFYAELYKKRGLRGGHIIILNAAGTEFYEPDREQAFRALKAYPGGFHIGGGITPENAEDYLEAGASHVIVTSYVFKNGEVNFGNLDKIKAAAGKEHLVLDLSCRRRDGEYIIVTDRWQKFTSVRLDEKALDMFSSYCDEFLIHAVDAEGKAKGIEGELAEMLGKWGKIPVTYAGGIGSFEHLEQLKILGKGKLDFTVGSALDIFGGSMDFEKTSQFH